MRQWLILGAFGGMVALAQTPAPVMWTVGAAPRGAVRPGAAFEVTVVGTPAPGWHLYGLQEPDGGPIATEVGVREGDPVSLMSVTASKPAMVRDANFNLMTAVYVVPARFTLHLRANGAASAGPLRVLVRYQCCSRETCLPPRTEVIMVPLRIGG